MKEPIVNFAEYELLSNRPPKLKYKLNVLLFFLTFITTTFTGVQWSNRDYFDLANIQYGLTYSILILIFITAHEFGHFFAARFHKVNSTLPFYIPAPAELMLFGTFGAVIKTKSPIRSRKALFDIGAAGPLAGFIICLIFLAIGFMTLPPKDYIYSIHPEYLTKFAGEIPQGGLIFGDTILFSLFASIFKNPESWLPPMNEIYHYPFLCVGWFGLFVTSLNLLPIGQLDGGHVLYSMFGSKQKTIAKYFWWVVLIVGIFGTFGMLHDIFSINDPSDSVYTFFQGMLKPGLDFLYSTVPFLLKGWSGWLFWAIITRIFIKLPHPEIQNSEPLNPARMALGWLCIIILILSISFNGITIVE